MKILDSIAHAAGVERIGTAVPAVAAIALGALIVFVVGFASPEALHAAAHDGRHAFAFPCH